MKKMKKSLGVIGLLIMLSSMLLLSGCISKKTSLNVIITSSPQGGINVSRLSCSFEGCLTASGGLFGGVHPITATIEWWWENYFHTDAKVMKSETHEFRTTGTERSSTVYSTSSGYILLNYYWVKIKWTDENGTSHTRESSKAYCYSSGSGGKNKTEMAR